MTGSQRFTPRKANSMLLALLLLAPVTMTVMAPAAVAQAAEPRPEAQAPSRPTPSQPSPSQSASSQPQRDGLPAPVQQPGAAELKAQLDSVEYWLDKLSAAVDQLEYSGLVTFEHQGVLETLQVFHAVRDGEQVERLRYLSGAPRELISHGSGTSCTRAVSPIGRSSQWTNIDGFGAGSYQFGLRGGERIADRDTIVLEARPRDQHRLGVFLNIDRDTGLPLKSMLVDPQGRVLERYQFVQLDLSPISDEQLQPESPRARRIDNRRACQSAQTRWRIGWLPEGFQRVAVRTLADGDMLVFSDGLSVFTVFVQRLGQELKYKGQAIRGATIVYMDRVEAEGSSFTVTVVGEIPGATAQQVARSVGTSTGS